MKLTDTMYISVEGAHVTVELEVKDGAHASLTGERPQQIEPEETAGKLAAALKKVRAALEEIDEDEVVSAGVSGISIGHLFVQRSGEAVEIKENDEVIGTIPKQALREVAAQADDEFQ